MQNTLTFGKLLKLRRNFLDLTQAEVAQRAQCATETVRKLEAGNRRASKAVAQALAAALELEGGARTEFLRMARIHPMLDESEQHTPRATPPHGEAAPLLASKLYLPRSRPTMVARPRLLERLEAGEHVPLTLIAAPAGFGKTTILADWLNRASTAGRPVAWLALDASDADPILFLRYFIATLQKLTPAAGASVLPMLELPEPPLLGPLLPVLANDLMHAPAGSILVLDDYHVIDTPAIHQILSFIIDHLPPQLRVVIASRVDPPLPLARLRARGHLVELRASDLRFTAGEAAAFLQEVMNLPIAAVDVAALDARTEGWIAGLQLAALSMQELPPEQFRTFINSFSGSHRFVVDYLVDEVLASQPMHVQTFLRQSAILERFCASLCDAVVSTIPVPSQTLLEQLERANLFVVSLDDERRWYRYHHLFAQALRERLSSSTTAAEQSALHRRAALWFEEQGMVVDAINHYLAAQEPAHAARLLETHGLMLIVQGQARMLDGWLRSLPPALLHAQPHLIFLQALIFFNANAHDAAERTVRIAEAALAGNPLDEQARITRGQGLLIRGNIARARGDLNTSTALFRQALDILPATAATPRAAATLGIAQYFMISGDVGPDNQRLVTDALAWVEHTSNVVTIFNSKLTWAEFRRRQGHLRPAVDLFHEAANVSSHLCEQEALPNRASYYFGLGSILRELDEVETAEALLLQGQELCRLGRQAHGDYVTQGYVALARLQFHRGNIETARATLHEFLTLAQSHNFAPNLLAHVRAVEAEIALRQDDIAEVMHWAEATAPRLVGEVSYLQEQEVLTLVQFRAMQARRDRDPRLLAAAFALLDPLLHHAEKGSRLDSVIHIQIARALLLDAQGEDMAALQTLAETLEHAAPKGYVRAFVDEGAPLARLLSRGLQSFFASSRARRHAETLLKILGGEHTPSDHAPTVQLPTSHSSLPGSESLTPRELEVLRLLMTGASNQTIARELVVQLGTVKRHVSNIMDKLQAKSRLEAVARARARNII